jgi:TPR repeat protein
MKQREISHQNIHTAKQSGKKEEYKSTITYTNEATKVVSGKNGRVITVIENKRNTKFDLLQISKNKENKLIEKVKKNNDSAMCELAELYLSGDLGNKDINKAHNLLLRAADRGNSHAMCLLSNLHENGDLGNVDRQTSLDWLEKAANRNNLGAMAKLGQHYFVEYLKLRKVDYIDEQEKNNLIQKAKCYLERAADRGQTRAIWTIAKIHEEGYFGEIDLPKAIEFYTKAASLGSPSSLDSLNALVLEGKVSSEHFEAILDEVSLLLTKTSRGLAVEVGLKQINGLLGKNPKRGFEMVKRVAEVKYGGNVDAIRELAKCYRDGKGCEPDFSLAQYWFQQLEALYIKATNQENVQSMNDLGFLYLKDSLGKINLEKAEQAFIQAANTGDIDSIFHLGKLYITGELGDKEPSLGIKWVNKAIELWKEHAAHGDIEAMESLISLYLDEEGLGFKDYHAAAKWLSTRLEYGYVSSLGPDMFRLANGYHKKEQYAEAEHWYRILANKEHIGALESLARMHQKGQLALDINNETINAWALQLQLALHKRAEKSPMAALRLAKLYEKGDLLPKKIGEAVKWLFLASSFVDDEYIDVFELSNHHLNKILNFKDFTAEEKQEIIQGILHYKDNEEKPYRVGRILGDIYSQGILIEPNYQEALFWYEKAAKFGNSMAMCRIGEFYEAGVLGNINLPEAMKWYDLSATKGNKKAKECLIKINSLAELDIDAKIITEKWVNQVPLFRILLNGGENKPAISSHPKSPKNMYRLTEQYRSSSLEKDSDPWRAAYWFRKASQKRHVESAFALGSMYVSGELGQNVRPVGIRWYKEAAIDNHIMAMERLFDIYTDGIIVPQNLKKADKWKKRLSEQLLAGSLKGNNPKTQGDL